MKSEDTFLSVVRDVFVGDGGAGGGGGLRHPQGRVIATRATRGDAESSSQRVRRTAERLC